MESGGVAAILFLSLLYGLIDPITIIGGLIFGWFCRRWWHVIPAGIALALLEVVYTLNVDLQEGARIIWWALPVSFLAPLAWSGAGFALHRHLLREGSIGARLGWMTIGLLGGAVLGGASGALLGPFYVEWASVSSVEGESGYVVIFLFIVPGILIGATAGAVTGWRLSRR